MSRVIKFRVYDKELKAYLSLDYPLVIDQHGVLWDISKNTNKPFVSQLKPFNGEKVVIEWFTGLTDKNGVDIYEGDIVTDHVGIGSVMFNDKYAAFRVKYENPKGRGKWFLDYNIRGERESLEVIGNIHQNADLLEKG